MKIIEMSNETTATGYYYAVSDALFAVLDQASEEEISKFMPAQAVPVDTDKEEGDYLYGLKKLAIANGLSGNDVRVMPVDIPNFWFDSGWDTTDTRPKTEKMQMGPNKAQDGEKSAAGFEVVNVTLPSDGKFRALHDVLYLSKIADPETIETEYDACAAISNIMACGWSVWQFGDTAEDVLVFAVGEQGTPRTASLEADRFAVYAQGADGGFYPITFGIGSQVLDVPGVKWNGDPDRYVKTVKNLAMGA